MKPIPKKLLIHTIMLYEKTSIDKYHTLKGNGVGTQMYNALMALPTEPQHEGEE